MCETKWLPYDADTIPVTHGGGNAAIIGYWDIMTRKSFNHYCSPTLNTLLPTLSYLISDVRCTVDATGKEETRSPDLRSPRGNTQLSNQTRGK